MTSGNNLGLSPWLFPSGVPIGDDFDPVALGFVGFTYVITCLANPQTDHLGANVYQRYVGKKYLLNKVGANYKQRWRTYTGSSKSLNRYIVDHGPQSISREIVAFYDSRADTDYEEIRLQFAMDVLRKMMPDGVTRAFLNASIANKFYAKKTK